MSPGRKNGVTVGMTAQPGAADGDEDAVVGDQRRHVDQAPVDHISPLSSTMSTKSVLSRLRSCMRRVFATRRGGSRQVVGADDVATAHHADETVGVSLSHDGHATEAVPMRRSTSPTGWSGGATNNWAQRADLAARWCQSGSSTAVEVRRR